MRHPCPCCGYQTFEHPANGSYDICPVCYWEDDIVQQQDPTYAGGANRVNLIQARRNFQRFGAMEEGEFEVYVRGPLPEELPQIPQL